MFTPEHYMVSEAGFEPTPTKVGGTNMFLRGSPGNEEEALALESLGEQVCWNQQKRNRVQDIADAGAHE